MATPSQLHTRQFNKQLDFLENYLSTIRKEVDDKTRELDALNLKALHVENAKKFHKFETQTKKKRFQKQEKVRSRSLLGDIFVCDCGIQHFRVYNVWNNICQFFFMESVIYNIMSNGLRQN